jgi:two-component system, chemotaxis family, protein-glutamate methylesterase/glutaminase
VTGFPIVALVCSAGGIDALTRVLAPLPADLPAAVIVVQHLSPDHHSELAGLLDARTALSVVAATDGAALLPGQVLVTPSGQHALVTGEQTIALIRSGAAPPYRPSADLLLTTLAVTSGARAVAVVLSGRGNDAATGAGAVHRFGGTVIASTALTSTQAAMPQATIDRDVVDHVVPLDDIAELLRTLTTAPQPEAQVRSVTYKRS